MGIQDASLKVQPPFQLLVSKYIRDKTRRLIAELHSMELEGSEGVERLSFESTRGLLVYVAMI